VKKRSYIIMFAVVAVIFITVATIITVNLASNAQRETENEELMRGCLVEQGFYSGLNDREDLEYIAIGCQLWANNQQQ